MDLGREWVDCISRALDRVLYHEDKHCTPFENGLATDGQLLERDDYRKNDNT
jgi:hypothetical protein